MQLYFSHSYRDVKINTYFFTHLADHGFGLYADQKSPVWCVAKLERYLSELTGFLSIIPRRVSEEQRLGYSPYIGHELALARRAGVPRLLFVDDEVLNRFRTDFPEDAVPFVHDAPERDRSRHLRAVQEFKSRLDRDGGARPRQFKDRQATVVAAGGKLIAEAAEGVVELLDTNGYEVRRLRGKRVLAAFEDISLFETLVSSELCVFLLDRHLTYVDVLLGMVHAHSIPSIRLQYDPKTEISTPGLSGRLPWSKSSALLDAFKEQLGSFRRGFVEAVGSEAVRPIGTTQWSPEPQQLWDVTDGTALRKHVNPTHAFVLDEVERLNKVLGSTVAARSGRAQGLDACMELYRAVRRHHLAYELELPSAERGRQAIRTPADILSSKAATCIDLACLFASLLSAAGLSPLIVVLETDRYLHALAGYRVSGAPGWAGAPGLGDLRAAVALADVVLFEATGAAESDRPVAAETEQERRHGEKMLDFTTAREVAERMIRSEVRLRFAVDVSAAA